MASTRKGGKKASKARQATAAKSGKTAAATKATKRAAVEGGPGGAVDHPPVIITDGSAAIGLIPNVFRRNPPGGNTRIGAALRLVRVEARRSTGETEECIALNPGESAEIRVSTRVGNAAPVRSFTIRGANSHDPATSIVLEFDHGLFPAGGTDPEGRRLFRNPNRTITSLVISTSTGRTHNCSFVNNQPGLVFTIRDAHVDE